MGYYLNPGNGEFARAIRSEIYVDKTGMLVYTNKYLNTEQSFICVSRPRRFGKSMALKMLAAYYSRGCDSRELLKGLEIEKAPDFEEHLNKYDVIYLDMSKFLNGAQEDGMIKYLEKKVLRELRKAYGEFLEEQDIGLVDGLERIYEETGHPFIFLIDEWDCVMRERQESGGLQRQYLDFMLCLLKDQAYVELAYI
ncbi:MAG: AAA family ATPase, partial [Lachnospiraceae bacterium]|nr:AAA family ATPase [Lachnospiraceae bacterium]